MTIFHTNKVVLKNKQDGLINNNVSYFIKKYVSDCCICLQYPRDSVIIDCNHVFCRCCLEEMIKFSCKCPICSSVVRNVFKVMLVLLEDISEYILFKRIISSESKDYFDYPYSSVYYLDTVECYKSNSYCYQSHDGQNYFLSCKILNKLKKQVDTMPEFIYGRVKKIKEVVYNKKYCINHLLEESIIYIVDIGI
jgi:hypothetical protein